MTHIVHIIPTLLYGGAERTVVDLVLHSDPARFKHTIIVFFDKIPMADNLNTKSVQVIVVPKKNKLGWGLVGDLKAELRRLQPDIVHTHLAGADIWGRLAAWQLGIPVVTTEYNVKDDNWFHWFAKRLMCNLSARYIAFSDDVKAFMLSAYKIKKPIDVILPGIKLEKFASESIVAHKGAWRLAIIGRLAKQKGHKLALYALAQLKEYNWQLQIVGQGKLELALRNLAEKLEIQGQVIFTPPTNDVPSILKNTDLLLMPSLWEGLGIVAMEGMAAGVPVVGFKCPGLRAIIQDGVTGLLAEEASISGLVKKLTWCFDNRDNCAEIALRARAYARDNFGIDKMVSKYEELYVKLLNC